VSAPAEVVIAGGGVAAVEALIALRDLAGDRARITLVAPQPDFVYRPMQVAEHDVLILALGARAIPVFEKAITFGQPGAVAAMRELLTDLERGVVRRIGFVAPTMTGWSLPLYELALMTAGWARSHGLDPACVVLITPETRPFETFGAGASAAVGQLLADAGIEFVGSSYADLRDDGLFDQARRPLPVDSVVTLPLVRGPELPGVPAEPEYGFIPVDRHGRVTGLADVYAAGDATDFPVKQGGLASQQADTVAEHLAARLGAPVEPAPFRPVLQGMLFTGGAEPVGKIAGRYLTPYLEGRRRP
jgi:sulfide:quinone oxidoreductase